MNIRERINLLPDDARVSLISRNGEDIYDIAELRAELDKLSNSFPTDRMDWMRPSKAKEARIGE